MLDLAAAYRGCDIELLLTIFKSLGIDTSSWPDNWYDPIESDDRSYWKHVGTFVFNCLNKANAFADLLLAKHVVATLTADNQCLDGRWLDYADYDAAPDIGFVTMDSYYSYIMPLINVVSYISVDYPFTTTDELCYDFTVEKVACFNKYFKHWPYTYHPNCEDCVCDKCLIHCVNFNILLSQCFPIYNGPLVKKNHFQGQPVLLTAGYVSRELGIVYNKDDINTLDSDLAKLFTILCDASLHITATDSLEDYRDGLIPIGLCMFKASTVKPAEVNIDFYKHLESWGLLQPGTSIDLSHYYFMQDSTATAADFSLYKYNKTVMVDILQYLFCYDVTFKYFSVYEGGCITADEVVVRQPKKSAGYYLNRIGNAGVFYDSLTHEEQDLLYSYSKRNITPTITQVNLKRAISAKERARTVAGTSLLSTMTTRHNHQKLLKSIAAMRGSTIVIGTTKFYGGWDSMLRTLLHGVDKPILYGWDYPKCDRSYPTILRLTSSILFGRFHDGCCTLNQKFYRLCNELAQVITETSYCSGALYHKPGGQSSGDALTAYSNSCFNIMQVMSSTVGEILSHPTKQVDDEYIPLQRAIYEAVYMSNIYTCSTNAVDMLYYHMQKYCRLMVLSDDGVAAIDSDMQQKGLVPSLDSFKRLLYYQNNVVLTDDKCWVETDVKKGPHEFCSQHSKLVTINGECVYLPMPEPSRILSALVYVDAVEKANSYIVLERFVAMAMEAWPLIHHDNEYVRKIFPCILEYIKTMYSSLSHDVLETFGYDHNYDSGDFTSEQFYSNMYIKNPILQFAGACVVCGCNSVLTCANCPRRPHLCASCCYYHVTETSHKVIVGIAVYACKNSGCTVNDITQLFIANGSYYCEAHLPVTFRVPVCMNQRVFSLYMNTSTYCSDVKLFNKITMQDWKSTEDYNVYGLPMPLRLFAAETLRAYEEMSKMQYGYAILTSITEDRLHLSWHGPIPPINVNSVFCGYKPVVKGSDMKYALLGDFVFERNTDTLYTYTSSYLGKLERGYKFVLRTHSIKPLMAPTVIRNTTSSMYNYVYSRSPFERSIAAFKLLLSNTVSTVQGPPGTGKSYLSIGLACCLVGKRFMFTTASHAGVDALCEKAFKYLPRDKCTRIIPTGAKREVFQGFTVNNKGAQYIFSTINSLPNVDVDIVICDEVGMCTDSDLSLLNERVRYCNIVYVGDPQQLSAPRILCTTALPPLYYNTVVNHMIQHGPTVFLTTCYRCPSPIVQLVSTMCYSGKLTTSNGVGECYSVFLNTHASYVGGSSSAYNRGHIDYVRRFLMAYPQFQTAVFVSPYHSQNVKAKQLLGLNTWTVDAAQGSEAPYIIFSQTTASDHATNINRLNVALTRATRGILCIMCVDGVVDFTTPTLPPSCQGEFLRDLGGVVDTNGFVPRMCSDVYSIDIRNFCGYDVEAVHSGRTLGVNQIGTSFPFLLGFSGIRASICLSVQPTAFYNTDIGVEMRSVNWRVPKGFDFLKDFYKFKKSWPFTRRKIIQYVACQHYEKSQPVVFVVWSGRLEYSTIPYFVKYGDDKLCHCGVNAYYYSSTDNKYYCSAHYFTCDYLYNCLFYDVSTRVKLQYAHDSICTINHGDAHYPEVDARMTLCVLYHDYYITKEVLWDVTVSADVTLNKAMRTTQRNIIHAVVPSGSIIYDVGNPKGIAATKNHIYKYFDKQPLNTKVECYNYNADTFRVTGYSMFWNCNVQKYPDNAIVCFYDTQHVSSNNIPVDGGSLYCNKHVFFTKQTPTPKNLVEWKFVYMDTTPCSSDLTTSTGLYLNTYRCKTQCNDHLRLCQKHYEMFTVALNAYLRCIRDGFKFYVPKMCEMQGFDTAIDHFSAYNYFKPGASPAHTYGYCIGDRVYTRSNGVDLLVFTNTTPLPTTVAFELYTKRYVTPVPMSTILQGLGVNAFVDNIPFYQGQPYTTVTLNICDYTDVTNRDLLYFTGKPLDNNMSYILFSNSKRDDNSYLLPVGTSMVLDSVVLPSRIPYYLTKYVRGVSVKINTEYLSCYRPLDCPVDMLTPLEREFTDMAPEDFINKYDLQKFNLEHILYGEDIKTQIGGLHLFVGLRRIVNMKGWQHQQLVFNTTKPVIVYNVASTNGSFKYVTSVLSLRLDDFIVILKSLDLSVKSSVLSFFIDFQVVRFMLWANDNKVATFYPTLQAAIKPGYTVPKAIFNPDALPMPINIENYGVGVVIPSGVPFNVAKYMQLMQYLNTTTMCVPHKMRVLHLGAASHDLTAPGTAVIRQFLPEHTVITDCDLRHYASDADHAFSATSFLDVSVPQQDLIISDIYADRSVMFDLATYLPSALSLGGTIAIKITETSYHENLFAFLQQFSYWTVFMTAVNSSSSEAYLVGVNYLGVPTGDLSGSAMYNSYCMYRSIVALKPHISSLYDVKNYTIKHSITPIIPVRGIFTQLSTNVQQLLRAGRILIRDNID